MFHEHAKLIWQTRMRNQESEAVLSRGKIYQINSTAQDFKVVTS